MLLGFFGHAFCMCPSCPHLKHLTLFRNELTGPRLKVRPFWPPLEPRVDETLAAPVGPKPPRPPFFRPFPLNLRAVAPRVVGLKKPRPLLLSLRFRRTSL